MKQQPAESSRTHVLKELRALIPKRGLTSSESYILAEKQAEHALRLAEQRQPDVNLGWILELPRVEVQMGPRFRMRGVSGFTTFSHGRYYIMVNKNDAHARRRFTLAHEFKHLLDYTVAPLIHRDLGYGDPKRQAQQVENICNHFAACLLMPQAWVRNAWANGIRDVAALAGLFNVSGEAMENRLRFLGFIRDDTRPLRTYFRRVPRPLLRIHLSPWPRRKRSDP